MKTFSVIIPLYNKEKYILRTISSVLSQTLTDFEVLVINDGSTDNGPAIVKKIQDSRIRLITQENAGASAARNRGANLAQSDLLAFLDADDEWLPNHLEILIRLRNNFPDAGAYATAYKILEPSGNLRFARYRAIPSPPWEGLIPNFFLSAALGDSPINCSVMCIPKDIFFEVGGFPVGEWWGEDADLWGKIAIKYPIAFSWEQGGIYHWDSTNRLCDRIFTGKEPLLLTIEELQKKGEIPPDLIKDISEYLVRKKLYQSICLILAGEKNEAREILTGCKTKLFFWEKNIIILLTIFPISISRYILNIYLQK